ncbi:NAD(+)/NADH kinase [Helicobacter felis]|uniref:NAD kinase n=1 Tax=Helicobacter felis (strain ATCC 49179 / CCUG 28539 / NCTC 12436 / CS1) TaxID=936155 RepID=E7A8P5_HELFC|nr:NAD(+)/NADH kinase [Helicobacter felis]CBY82382.1 inorganic polyphosphate/ATP-NAD kinase [Helicobacter felis ATCC 49179]
MNNPPVSFVHIVLKPLVSPKCIHSLEQALKSAQITYDFNPKSEGVVLCLGGDGTLLGALRSGAACFGVHVGHLGFLSAANLENLQSFLEELKRGHYKIEKHLMLEAWLEDEQEKSESFVCANDIVVSRKDVYGILELELFVDDKLANIYQVDGLIFATPLGSSAYNISVGGSVVHPLCENILITPIAPHSLTQRPLILGAHVRLGVRSKKSCMVVIDGQQHHFMHPGQRLILRRASKQATLLQPLERDYFRVLREKFSWGGRN